MIIAIPLVVCLLTGCATSDPNRRIIESHLGVSVEGKAILDEYMFGCTNGPPNLSRVRHELLKHDDMLNLTVGLLMVSWSDELDSETINTNLGPADVKQVLDANLTRAGTTLVRPEDVSNITVETNVNERIVGSFDWVVPGQFGGRCRFVILGNKLHYLGVLRKDPVGIYDSETIISPYGDLLVSRQWIQTEYFVGISPNSDRTRAMTRRARQTEMFQLFRSAHISMMSWSPAKNRTLPLIYASDRATRDMAVELLADSKEWKVGHCGRAISTLEGPTLLESIEEQICKMGNTTLNQ